MGCGWVLVLVGVWLCCFWFAGGAWCWFTCGVGCVIVCCGFCFGSVVMPLSMFSELVFDQLLAAGGADAVKLAVDKMVFEAGHPFDVYRNGGGPVVHYLVNYCQDAGMSLLNSVEFAPKFRDRLGLQDYEPRVPLMREALALTSQLVSVLGALGRGREALGNLWVAVKANESLASPDGVYALSFDAVAAIVDIV